MNRKKTKVKLQTNQENMSNNLSDKEKNISERLNEYNEPFPVNMVSLNNNILPEISLLEISEACKELPLRNTPNLISDNLYATVEEIAEDIVHIIRSVKQIEGNQDHVAELLAEIRKEIGDQKHQISVEFAKLKNEFFGEQKALINRKTFDTIIPTLDSLIIMKDSLSLKQKGIPSQLDSVIALMNNVIQSLGFSAFQSEIGSGFNPAQMECIGFSEKGEPGTIVKVIRPGYKAGSVIVRPCGVLLAKMN